MTEKQAQKLFNTQLAAFRKYFPLVGVKLVIHNKENTEGCNKFRDVAWASFKFNTINICKRVLDFSENTITGLFRHEIGHLCDSFVESKHAEQRADDIAHLVFGTPIRYSGPHNLQTIGEGIYPRPEELHA